MKLCSDAEVKCLKDDVPFYDFGALTIVEGTEHIIRAVTLDNCMQYGDIELGHCSFSDYQAHEEVLLHFLSTLFDAIPEEECTVIKYEPQWVVREEDAPELTSLLGENGIDNDVYGITLSKHDRMVKEFLISSFRYNSFIQLLFPGEKIIITPSDHMELFLDLSPSELLAHRIERFLCHQGKRQKDGSFVLQGPSKLTRKSKYRITKYDPKFRNSDGVYTKEDWTAYCDIGRVYGDVTFTLEEYLRVEANYVNTILQALYSLKGKTLYIRKLENRSTADEEKESLEKYGLRLSSEEKDVLSHLRDGKKVSISELPIYLRLLLRECFWCELHTEKSTIILYPGYDYYMYLHCEPLDENIITSGTKQGIYMEDMGSVL